MFQRQKIFMLFQNILFFFNETILHIACESKNIDLVKYIISLKAIDINAKTIFFSTFFIKFQI